MANWKTLLLLLLLLLLLFVTIFVQGIYNLYLKTFLGYIVLQPFCGYNFGTCNVISHDKISYFYINIYRSVCVCVCVCVCVQCPIWLFSAVS